MESKIIDSSVYVSLFVSKDINNERAFEIFNELGEVSVLVPYLIYQETLTVLHNKYSLRLAQKFDALIHSDDRFIIISSDIAEEILFWREHNHTNISYIDMALVYSAIKYKSELITFDKSMGEFYKKLV